MYINYRKVTRFTESIVSTLLATDDVWLERAIVALHSRQVELEKLARTTINLNEVGFQQADAKMFSKFAEIINRKLAEGIPLGKCLDENRKRYARRPWCRPRTPIPTICKYRKQILDLIEENARKRLSK